MFLFFLFFFFFYIPLFNAYIYISEKIFNRRFNKFLFSPWIVKINVSASMKLFEMIDEILVQVLE